MQEVKTFKICFRSELKGASALDFHGFSLLRVVDWDKVRSVTVVGYVDLFSPLTEHETQPSDSVPAAPVPWQAT